MWILFDNMYLPYGHLMYNNASYFNFDGMFWMLNLNLQINN